MVSTSQRRQFIKFPLLEEVTNEHECLVPSVREEIMNHLEILSKSFDGYFKTGELKMSED